MRKLIANLKAVKIYRSDKRVLSFGPSYKTQNHCGNARSG